MSSWEAMYSAGLVALFVVATFSYTFLIYDRSMLEYWMPASVALFYLGGACFGLGLIGAVAAGRTALTAAMFFWFVFYFAAVREQVLAGWDPVLSMQAVVGPALTMAVISGLIVLLVSIAPQRFQIQCPMGRPQLRSSMIIGTILTACLIVQLIIIISILSEYKIWQGGVFIGRGEVGTLLISALGAPIATILVIFLFPLLYITPLIVIINLDRRTGLGIWALALLSLLLGGLINNPAVIPRFQSGALIIGTLMLIIGPHRAWFAFMILLGGTSASPLLNAFRNAWTWQYSNPTVGLAQLRGFDYDAFTMICYGVLHSVDKGIMYGANLLSTLLFFVPRAVWPGKPEYTGSVLYESVVVHFRTASPTNLSAPVPVEGYLAFGWVGMVALSLAFAGVVRWLDSAPRLDRLRDRSLSAWVLCLAFSPVLTLFLARGSLLPTFAYNVGVYTSIFVAVHLVRAPRGRHLAGVA